MYKHRPVEWNRVPQRPEPLGPGSTTRALRRPRARTQRVTGSLPGEQWRTDVKESESRIIWQTNNLSINVLMIKCTTRPLRRSYGRVSVETFEKTSFFSQAKLVGETKTFTSNNHGARRPTRHCLLASLRTNDTTSRRRRGLAGEGRRLLASGAAAPGSSQSWHDESWRG